VARASKASAASKKKATTKKAAATKGASPAESPAKKVAAKGSRAGKSTHFDSKFLERMRKLLHVERDTYERQARQLRAEADSLVMDMDPGDVQFDEESGEGDTIAVERGRDLALAARAMEMIEEIDHALSKFDQGTYGICEVSGEPIPEERLEAIPWAREKVEYKVGGFGRR
jgi:RNA polymerase-binding transcription factor DksA